MVVLLRLISESKETEEEGRGRDHGPSIELERKGLNQDYRGPGILDNVGVFPVRVSPGDPRADATPQDV